MATVGLMLFFMFIFAVAGTTLYSAVYHQKCYSDITGLPEEYDQVGKGGQVGGWGRVGRGAERTNQSWHYMLLDAHGLDHST